MKEDCVIFYLGLAVGDRWIPAIELLRGVTGSQLDQPSAVENRWDDGG